jgi:DNA-binding NarL/FixJ family response regulator
MTSGWAQRQAKPYVMSHLASRLSTVALQRHSNDSIAQKLGISEKTVRNQVSAIRSKLGATSRVQAVVRARETGFGHKED